MIAVTTGPAESRIGVFGGTFDPPHVGHLVAALEAQDILALDRMLLVVAHAPWQKAGQPMASAEDRLALVEAAVEGVAGLEASRLEIDRRGPSYTVDTLVELRRRHPGAELFLVLGADAAAGLTTWARWERVPELANLVVIGRPGADRPLVDGLPWLRLEVPSLEVSSTDLRRRVAAGRPIHFLVPPRVVRCIAERGLYRGTG